MDPHPDNEKRDALAAQIQPVKGSKIASDFAGAVLGCTLIGWGIDHLCDTKPWAMVVMLIVGFCVGVFGAWRTLSPPDKN